MQFHKLYRKLYFYAFGTLLVTLILTFSSMSVIFDQRQQGMIQKAVRQQILFIRKDINRTEFLYPQILTERISELSQQLGWDIVYWKYGKVYTSTIKRPPIPNLDQLKALQRKGYLLTWKRGTPEVLMYVQRGRPYRGILWMKLRALYMPRFFMQLIIAALLLLFFLALLLLPYTRYLFRPYRKLEQSIQIIAEGDLSHKIDEREFKDFSDLVHAFNNMSTQIQAMMRQKQRMMADVSHELRSPLTRLRMILEVLGRKPNHDQQYLDKGIKEIEELDRIIQDILDLSRLELDKIPLDIQQVDLSYLLYQKMEQHEEIFESKNFRFNLDLPQESLWVNLDPKWINRVFNNLFSNLVKYVPENTWVDIQLAVENNTVLFRIRDRGPGIAIEDQAKVFTPFYRADLSRSRRTGGVGLGLAIVKYIVDAHGGEIQVNTPEDQIGLEFKFTLPYEKPS